MRDLVAATGRNKASVQRTFRRLVGLGLVQARKEGRSVRYVPDELVHAQKL